jgi:hypothetical protein
MSHGRTGDNPSIALLPSTTENGVSLKREIDLKSTSELPSNNPFASYIKTSTWCRDTETDGGVPDHTSTREDGRTAE